MSLLWNIEPALETPITLTGLVPMSKSRSPDPIDMFFNAGLPSRALVGHSAEALEWLAQHSDGRLRLCYLNEAGDVVEERVGRIGLLRRAHELGWEADGEAGALYFKQSVHFEYGGTTWFASAYDDDAVPLSLPEATRARLRRMKEQDWDRHYKRLEHKRAREALAAESLGRRRTRDTFAEGMEYFTQQELQRAEKAGRPVKPATARKRVMTRFRGRLAEINAKRRGESAKQLDLQTMVIINYGMAESMADVFAAASPSSQVPAPGGAK